MKLRLDASGRSWPQGNTVTNPAAVGWVTVTFSTTLEALSATPSRGATWTTVIEPRVTGPAPAPSPSAVASPGLVSNTRAGASNGTKPLAEDADATPTATNPSDHANAAALTTRSALRRMLVRTVTLCTMQ